MSTLMQRPETILNCQATPDTAWFVCIECNLLNFGVAAWLPTSDYGEDRVFCRDCVKWCGECKMQYASCMKRYHEDCVQSSSEEKDDD